MRGMKNLLQLGDSPPTMRRSPRQLWWGGLFLSSLIAMGSTFEAVRMQRYYSPPNSTQRWAVGSITTTFLLAFLSLTLQMIPQAAHRLMGTKLELALIFVVSAFACAAVGTATNPATGMAINASGGISFGNLYYSTWASFGCGMALLISFIRTERGMDVSSELKSRGKRFRLWVILIITTLIVMGSSASSYDAKCDKDEDFRPIQYCRRSAFGVSAGCIGCVISLAVVAIRVSCTPRENGQGNKKKIVFAVECISSLIMLCFYCFAAAYLTSEEGPGAPLGNLYYSTWITFGLIFFVATSCFEEFQAAKLVYSHRNQQGGDVGEGGFSSIDLSNHGRPVDWPDNENHVPVESNLQEENGFRQAAPPVGNRSGSVGEVQI
eukprot:CAMPEP_0201914296 /NCGR_PEP_ID=MMETSP0903-20130614/4519_1 /ASSEMBLY_ACC=CAM_ASM_000552 /TAXON_ID=420261 /ORGANISM="Thalassiosira antarctica, Strain CCMP982" /LENGTH=378 /DNA_ID=CAMNT_0048449655 /DNA_START=34 /DNA_END=1170 /DNA_ORIENTATION=-